MFFASSAKAAEESVISCYDDLDKLDVRLINYPPVYIYVLSVLAHFYHAFTSAPLLSTGFLCLMKTATVFCEILIAWMLFLWVKKYHDEKAGVWVAGFFFLNPAVIYVGSYFGQVDAVLAAFLFAALVCLVERHAFWAGVLLAGALLMKIMTIAFLPFFFLFYPIKREWRQGGFLVGGFILGCLAILSPYLFTGRLGLVYQRCFEESVQWGNWLTVGAFNIWSFHPEPLTFDGRNWGWLFGFDAQRQTNWLLQLLTYKKLGMGIFGLFFLLSLFDLFKKQARLQNAIPLALLSLAFFLFPTRMHERYLFPFLVFYAATLAAGGLRPFFYVAWSLTYLINIAAICPLFTDIPPLEQIYGWLSLLIASLHLVLFAGFVGWEYIVPYCPTNRIGTMAKSFGLGFVLILIGWAVHLYSHKNPETIYLSALSPVSIQQTWPVVPAKDLLKQDRSTDGNQLQIDNTVYRYGIGAHAYSRIAYDIPGTHNLFESYIGVDAEVRPIADQMPDAGTVTFSVLVNGKEVYQSPLMIATSPPRYVSLRLPEGNKTNRLTLIVNDAGDGNHSDHANWALARVWLTHPQ